MFTRKRTGCYEREAFTLGGPGKPSREGHYVSCVPGAEREPGCQ